MRSILKLLLLLFLTSQILFGKESYTIAAFYYPWYSGTNNIHWPEGFLREHLIPQQLPELGLYDSYSSSVIDKHVFWSENYGIDVWIVSWWGQQSREDNYLNNYIMPRLIGNEVKFCIIYESGILPSWNWDNETARNRFKNDMLYIANKYFNHPNYFKIEDKSVVYVYVTRGFYGNHDLGMQETKEALTNKGYDVFFIADGIDSNNSLNEYDALSLYLGLEVGDCMSWDGSYPYQNNCFQQIEDNWNYLKSKANDAEINFIPNIAPGFNKDGWGSNPNQFWSCPPRIHPDSSHISVLSKMCDIAISYIDTSLKLVTVTSFNEWHEDTQIEPTIISDETNIDDGNGHYTNSYYYKGYGIDRLSIIAEKFNKDFTNINIDKSSEPYIFSIKQNFPNPFNLSTTIPVHIPKSSKISLDIYNILGQKIATIFYGKVQPGKHSFVWNSSDNKGMNISSGIYLVELSTNTGIKNVRKLLLMK